MITLTTPPTLYIFAGPNGAGKSTLFSTLKQANWLQDIEQVNGDVLYKENPTLTQDELASIVSERIKSLLNTHLSFSIESNLATSASYNVVQSARKKAIEQLFSSSAWKALSYAGTGSKIALVGVGMMFRFQLSSTATQMRFRLSNGTIPFLNRLISLTTQPVILQPFYKLTIAN